MVVNKITWAKVGGITKPGRYMFRSGWLTITAEDLAIWQQLPNAEFTLASTIPTTGEMGSEFRLGTLPETYRVLPLPARRPGWSYTCDPDFGLPNLGRGGL